MNDKKWNGQPYRVMADVYDAWMAHDQVPYDSWAEFVLSAFRRYGRVESVLDVGCGTGQLLVRLQNARLRVLGVDASARMLASARARLGPYVSLTQLRLPDQALIECGPVDAVTACFDVLNYLVEGEAFERTILDIGEVLAPGGVFVFDLNTKHKLETVFANYNTGDDLDDFAYVWRNRYSPLTGVSTFHVTFFVQSEEGVFERSSEMHEERWFPTSRIESALVAAGLSLASRTDSYSDREVTYETLRETWVVTKEG